MLVDFEAWLKNQPLGYQQVFGSRKAGRVIALLAYEESRLDRIIVGNQPLQSNDSMRAPYIGSTERLCLTTDTNLKNRNIA